MFGNLAWKRRAGCWGAFAVAMFLPLSCLAATDWIITTPTVEYNDVTVTGNLEVFRQFVVVGFLNVNNSAVVDVTGITPEITTQSYFQIGTTLDNNGKILTGDDLRASGELTNGPFGTMDVGGQLLADSNVINAPLGQFVVRGAGDSTVSGQLTNGGLFVFGNGTDAAQLKLGALNNLAGADLHFLSGASLSVTGLAENAGTIRLDKAAFTILNGSTLTNASTGNIRLTLGDFQTQSGAAVINLGRITVSEGVYTNNGTTRNAGAMILTKGAFANNPAALLQNDGTIALVAGAFDNYGTLRGDGTLDVVGTATFYAGSTLSGNPTVKATALNLQGTTSPGGYGTAGQMTFNAATTFAGIVQYDLMAPGTSDVIQIAGTKTGTLASGAQFDFHVATPPGDIGDKYKILQGNLALSARPVATDDVADGRRVVLRTDADFTRFDDVGTAYYALIARDASFEQLARDNAARGNVVTFGRYLDQLPADDGTIGTANADVQWVRDTLDLMPAESAVASALGQLVGDIYVPMRVVSLQRQFMAYSRLASRLREDTFEPGGIDPAGAASTGAVNCEGAVVPGAVGWSAGYGFGGTLDGNSNLAGSSYAGGGVQFLAGFQPRERLDFGVFYDFGAYRLKHDSGDRGDAQAHSWGGYLVWHRDIDYFLFLAGGGCEDSQVTRAIAFSNPQNAISRVAQGEPTGAQAAVYGEYGVNLRGEDFRLRPYLGLMYMAVLQDAFVETGADGLDLNVQYSSINSLRSLLGGQFDVRSALVPSLTWMLQAVWGHEYLNEATNSNLTATLASMTDNSYVIAGPVLGRDWFSTGVGVRTSFLTEHLRPFANYNVILNSSQTMHAAWGGLEYVW